MKIMFWILATGLLIVMADYTATRNNADACQLPPVKASRLFQ